MLERSSLVLLAATCELAPGRRGIERLPAQLADHVRVTRARGAR